MKQLPIASSDIISHCIHDLLQCPALIDLSLYVHTVRVR